jgi:hypothetical protein
LKSRQQLYFAPWEDIPVCAQRNGMSLKIYIEKAHFKWSSGETVDELINSQQC